MLRRTMCDAHHAQLSGGDIRGTAPVLPAGVAGLPGAGVPPAAPPARSAYRLAVAAMVAVKVPRHHSSQRTIAAAAADVSLVSAAAVQTQLAIAQVSVF